MGLQPPGQSSFWVEQHFSAASRLPPNNLQNCHSEQSEESALRRYNPERVPSSARFCEQRTLCTNRPPASGYRKWALQTRHCKQDVEKALCVPLLINMLTE